MKCYMSSISPSPFLYIGTNACYTERLEAVTKFSGDRSKHDKVIINCEWGAFGNQGSLDDILTEVDRAFDSQPEVENSGTQMYMSCDASCDLINYF